MAAVQHFSRLSTILCGLVMMLSLVPTASAKSTSLVDSGDSPYSPRLLPLNELISTGTFSQSPIVLPWPLMASRVISDKGRMDFEHHYQERFENVMSHFSDAYRQAADIMPLERHIIPYSGVTHLKVLGMQHESTYGRITLGYPGLPRHFILDIHANGDTTRVVFLNAVYAMLYSGVMPARVNFQPAGAKPIPFRWN